MKGIYKIVCLSNNRVYIGKSVDIKYRILSHQSLLRNCNHFNIYLQRAWNKYGEKSFSFEVLEECEETLLNDKEIYWIDTLKSESRRKGFNLQIPQKDKHFRHSEESKKRMSKSQKGKSRSVEQKNKIKQTLKEKAINGLSHINTLALKRRIPIYQYDMNGNFIKKWDYVQLAADFLKLDRRNIMSTCNGKYKHCGKFRWSFAEILPLKERKSRDKSTYTGKRKTIKL